MFSARSKACRVSDERKYEPAGGRIFRLSMQFFSSNPTQLICDNKYLPLFFNLHKNYIYCLNNLFLLLWLYEMFVIYITQALIVYCLTVASDFNKKWYR